MPLACKAFNPLLNLKLENKKKLKKETAHFRKSLIPSMDEYAESFGKASLNATGLEGLLSLIQLKYNVC